MHTLYLKRDELAHYGVQGQKWGVRRYQDESGALTEEGRLHYGLSKDRQELYSRAGINKSVGDRLTRKEKKAFENQVLKEKKAAVKAYSDETNKGIDKIYNKHGKNFEKATGEKAYNNGEVNPKFLYSKHHDKADSEAINYLMTRDDIKSSVNKFQMDTYNVRDIEQGRAKSLSAIKSIATITVLAGGIAIGSTLLSKK